MSKEGYKAQRRTIKIGDVSLEVAMLPNGSYVFSQSQVTQVVDRPEISIRRLKRSRWLKSMPELHSGFDTLSIVGTNKPIAPVSPEVAALYWQKCASPTKNSDLDGQPSFRISVGHVEKHVVIVLPCYPEKLLPWPSFDALTKAVQKFKSESN